VAGADGSGVEVEYLKVLVEQEVVLDDYQGVAGLFQNGHELKDYEGSADLYFDEPVYRLPRMPE
jgi:hypothetical protein